MRQTEVLICLSCDSREQPTERVGQAIAAGGSTPNPAHDLGFMHPHGCQDLDGHRREPMCMEHLATVLPGPADGQARQELSYPHNRKSPAPGFEQHANTSACGFNALTLQPVNCLFKEPEP